MNATTLKALRLSIAHHKRNLKAKYDVDVILGPGSCALCTLFWRPDDEGRISCLGCPVYESTRAHGCRNTPYAELRECLDAWLRGMPDETSNRRRTAFRSAERAEIKFLESLLPKGKKK